MTRGLEADEVLRVLAALDADGLRAWVAGGWGVDVLVGQQTRVHRDLDLVLDTTVAPLDLALNVLESLDYAVETDWRPSRIELAAPSERWVDVHPVVFDDQGTGWQANLQDLPPFRYPAESFTLGLIGGVEVGCLSVQQQLLFHTGYPLRPQDLADIDLLRQLES